MSVSSRGTPPRPTPLEPGHIDSVQKKVGLLSSRPQLVNAIAKDTTNKGIVNATTARQYLEDSQWIAKGEPFTRHDLFATLVKVSLLTQSLQKSMGPTMRALAFLSEVMDAGAMQELADACGVAVGDAVVPPLNEMLKAQNGIHDVVEGLKGESLSLKLEVEGSRVEVRALETKFEALKASIEAAVVAAASVPSGPASLAPRSYATVTAATLTSAQADLIARNTRMSKQILVDKASDAASDSLAGLSELELKGKANMALELMATKREGAAFVGARRLQNGGVVFDCKDELTARWVKESAVMAQFVAALGGSCVYRPRRTELVAEMVPVGTRIEDAGTWRLVESDSGLPAGAIAGGRWLKPIHRRTKDQKVAHVRLEFLDPDSANHAIDNGVFVGGIGLKVRRPEEEARRCAKCQCYDHLAVGCKSDKDVCARCAGSHRTADCVTLDSGTFRCANCKVDGHSAADRRCPVFQQAQARKRARDPTAGYRYFPTSDPRTWARDVAPETQNGPSPGDDARTHPSRGTGRLAGGASGQGAQRSVDNGWGGEWGGRRSGALVAGRANAGPSAPAVGGRQPTIGEAFIRQEDNLSQHKRQNVGILGRVGANSAVAGPRVTTGASGSTLEPGEVAQTGVNVQGQPGSGSIANWGTRSGREWGGEIREEEDGVPPADEFLADFRPAVQVPAAPVGGTT